MYYLCTCDCLAGRTKCPRGPQHSGKIAPNVASVFVTIKLKCEIEEYCEKIALETPFAFSGLVARLRHSGSFKLGEGCKNQTRAYSL